MEDDAISDMGSYNMLADRKWFESEEIGTSILNAIPETYKFTRVLPSLRFIIYPSGGFIAPHVDGVRFDAVTQHPSTHSFLLYMIDTLEGGATEFLTAIRGGEVVETIQPKRGSILIFPHNIPHQGTGVDTSKILLRGDLY
ncbi:hypothetical protein AKO1_002373 [Acrasis kona]